MVTLADRFAPNDADVAGAVLDYEAVLVNLSTGVYYSLNRLAGLVWTLVQQRCMVKDVVEAIVARYDVTVERARLDVTQLLESMRQDQLIVLASEGAAAADLPAAGKSQTYEQPTLHAFEEMRTVEALY